MSKQILIENRDGVREIALLDGSQMCTLDGAAVGSGFSISSSALRNSVLARYSAS